MTQDITINLVKDIQQLIESAKQRVSSEFNLTHVMLNWHIGKRINEEILKLENYSKKN